ncbi:MAG TPA: AAC(3) family N-acetyltransferase [Actinopolymorphaceae bacterium]
MTSACVTYEDIVCGLRLLGLDKSSDVLVHASLRSFGRVNGGAETVCRALVEVCGTVMMTAGAWDLTRIPAPPGLARPHNADEQSASWEDFEEALSRATPYSKELPVSRWLGRVAETMRHLFPHERSDHPLFSYLAVGTHARTLIEAQRPDFPLGSIQQLAELGGDVLLLGVGHTSNTTIHLAEQRLGRSRFFRYAKVAPGAWMELPNLGGCSDGFDAIEPELAPVTREVTIGRCRARRVAVADVISHAVRMIEQDPSALLCGNDECGRCAASLHQRLAVLGEASAT